MVKDWVDLKEPSEWQYTKDDISPHAFAILQAKAVSCGGSPRTVSGECTATQLQIRHKVFYDVTIAFSFKVNDLGGYIGAIFRKKDDFNYYAVDIGADFARFRKMYNGVQSILSEKAISEKLLMDTWYNVEVQVVQNRFTLKWIKQPKDLKNNILEAPLILKGEDLYLKSGAVALFTENAFNTYFDDFAAH